MQPRFRPDRYRFIRRVAEPVHAVRNFDYKKLIADFKPAHDEPRTPAKTETFKLEGSTMTGRWRVAAKERRLGGAPKPQCLRAAAKKLASVLGAGGAGMTGLTGTTNAGAFGKAITGSAGIDPASAIVAADMTLKQNPRPITFLRMIHPLRSHKTSPCVTGVVSVKISTSGIGV